MPFLAAIPIKADDVHRAETHIVYEQGQWVLYLDVFFANELRRFRMNSYRSQRLAQVAATQMLRYAGRQPG